MLNALRRGIARNSISYRCSNLGWRKSVAEAAIGANTGFPWPLGVNAARRHALGIGKDEMAIAPYYPRGAEGLAGDAGLRSEHVITAVNGENPRVEGRAFLVWFRLRFEPGDAIELTVMDGKGRTKLVKYTAP